MKSLRATSALASHLTPRTPATRLALPTSTQLPGLTTTPQRTFLTNPFGSNSTNSPQTLTASRILPYPRAALYNIISDVSSYTLFVPFCLASTVTSHSNPDRNDRTWPSEAELTVGFDGLSIRESFYSRVYCDGHSVVEAVSGDTETSLPADAIAHYGPRPRPEDDKARNATVLTHLLTRWILRPFPFKPAPVGKDAKPQDTSSELPAKEQTEVDLNIEYAFANPLYGALSAAAAPKVAEKMIEAFEGRVKAVMDGPSLGTKTGVTEGVLRPWSQKP